MATAIAVAVVAAVGATAQLLVGRLLLDQILAVPATEFEATAVLPEVAALVIVSTVLTLATVVQSSASLVLAEAIGRRATGRVLDVAQAAEPARYEDPDFHDQLERARFNATSRPAMAVNGLLGVITAAGGAVGVVVALVVIEPLLVPLALAGAIPAWLAATANSRRYHAFTVRHTAQNRLRSYLMHVLSNRDLAKELRVYGAEAELRRRHDSLYDERVDLVRQLARSRRRVALAAAVAAALVMLASLWVLFWAVETERVGLASAGTALFALLFLTQRMRTLVTSASTLYEAALFFQDVERFGALAPGAPSRADPGPCPPVRPAPLPAFETLTVEGLRFSYPGTATAALDGVDLCLHRGETVALVGENGSGKTTLAKVLAGIYRPGAGRLCWDATDLDTVSLTQLRSSVAVVFQDHARFQLSARDNVVLGDPERLDDDMALEVAAAAAGATEVVAGLPGGWDQVLSKLFEGGVDLSGGQWQRLALARALFRQAPLLILDEPSSALDARAEAALFEHLRSVAAPRTVLFISHRFSSVRLADRIYVLADGRVVEQGTHTDLMALGGHYEDMYRLQASVFGT